MLTDNRRIIPCASCPDPVCNEVAFEAWERMTYGGIVVRIQYRILGNVWYPKWLPPFVGEAKDGYTEYVAD